MRRSIWLLVVLFFSSVDAYSEKLNIGVFLTSDAAPLEVEKILKKDKVLSHVGIKVYSQFKDFQIASAAEPFDIVILPSAYFKFNKNYTPALQFVRKGESQFRYQVFSLDKDWDARKINEGSVGLIEEVDRQQAKVLVKEILEGKEFKRIKPVSRIQDLYPMLALGNSNYIIISPWVWESVKSNLAAQPNKVITTLDIPYPQAGYLGKNEAASRLMKDLASMSKETLKALGFDDIKSIDGK